MTFNAVRRRAATAASTATSATASAATAAGEAATACTATGRPLLLKGSALRATLSELARLSPAVHIAERTSWALRTWGPLAAAKWLLGRPVDPSETSHASGTARPPGPGHASRTTDATRPTGSAHAGRTTDATRATSSAHAGRTSDATRAPGSAHAGRTRRHPGGQPRRQDYAMAGPPTPPGRPARLRRDRRHRPADLPTYATRTADARRTPAPHLLAGAGWRSHGVAAWRPVSGRKPHRSARPGTTAVRLHYPRSSGMKKSGLGSH